MGELCLKSNVLEMDDYDQAIELFYQKGWTDGLPVVLPTEKRVREMLEYIRRDPQEVIGEVQPKGGIATIEQIAVNAIMGGCLPEYLPVVIVAVEAMLEEIWFLRGVQCTSNCISPLAIINGPARHKLNMNWGGNLFGGGNRANAAIGRAIRLVLWNIGGGVPPIDNATCGHPGKYTYCVAEDEESNHWEPLHVEQGFKPDQSTVTMVTAYAPYQIMPGVKPIDSLDIIAETASTLGSNQPTFRGHIVVGLNPADAGRLKAAGWTKQSVKQYIYEKAKRRLGDLNRCQLFVISDPAQKRLPSWINLENEDTMVPCISSPEDVYIIVGGRQGVNFNFMMPSWGFEGPALTKEVKFPDE